jgi:pilus assembly protein TadC
MTVVFPSFAFLAVFALVMLVSRRQHRTVSHLNRHLIVPMGAAAIAAPLSRTRILGMGDRAGVAGQWATRVTRPQTKRRSARLLKEADSSMPLATFLLLRVGFAFALTPLFVFYVINSIGFSVLGVLMLAVGMFTIPQLPVLRVKRRARKRGRAIDLAMPDALDLMVVCTEGGLSLDGAMQQVSNRTEGVLANELRRLLQEVGSGLSRRDALQSLSERSQSESLKIFCATIIQADRMGMSIASTLRTLAETMRMRRRQAAETQARKAPIKMLPFLTIFMIPSLFIIILGPVVLNIVRFFQGQS